MLYEFDKTYTKNPSDVSVTGTGSGVHLYKDVTLGLTFSDRQGRTMNNIREIRDNQFMDDYNVSIIDTAGAIVYENYRSGYNGSYFTLTENENTAIFGEYQKDFGIRLDIFDKTTVDISHSELYVYGNSLDIDFLFIRDGGGYYLYNSGWQIDDPATSDVEPTYTGEIQAGDPLTGKMTIEMTMFQDPRYTRYEKVDIYYGTGSGVRNNIEDFYKTIYIVDQSRAIEFDIVPDGGLVPNFEWWFWFVPHSELCSGSGFLIGPHYITIPLEPERKCVCEQICIPEGDCEANLNVETGEIFDTFTKIHTIDTGNYKAFDYLFEATDAEDITSADKLLIAQTGTGITEFSITGYATSKYNRLEYQINNGDLEARVTNVSYSPATYCFFRTQLG